MLLRSRGVGSLSNADYDDLLYKVVQAAPKERDGILTEQCLDEMGIPETEEELERKFNPKKMKLNEMSATRQRACVITGASYQALLDIRKTLHLQQLASQKQRETDSELKQAAKQTQAEEKKRNAEDKQEWERKIKACMGTTSSSAPRPDAPIRDDVRCFFHGMWRAKWRKVGLDDQWNQCRHCDQWFCSKCSSLEKVLKNFKKTKNKKKKKKKPKS